MESKKYLSLLVIGILIVSVGFIAVPVGAYGPKSDEMLIHIYLSPDAENLALEECTLDINDWPLAKEYIDRWVTDPNIQLRSYTELGMMEIDIYNRRWPTGCPVCSDEDFQGCARCRAAREFRKAVAYLTNKEKYISEYLKGYGYRLDFPVPPFQAPYLPDPGTWTKYDFDRDLANQTLWNAGFRDYDDDGVLEWSNVFGIPDPWKGNDGSTYEELPPLKFWVRMDDPNRKAAGEDLAAELMAMGIPVDLHVTERSTCYKNVMVIYDYNLYTGGWSLGTIPDTYYDLYSSYTYFYPIGWSLNYPGFMNSTFDAYATTVKYPKTEEEAIAAAKQCGVIVSQSVPVIWLWSSAAVKAYKTGWSGVVNVAGYGIDSYLTFCLMNHATDTCIDWGFKSDIEQLNMISSQWLWDRYVLGLIYESMMGANPFTLKTEMFYLAKNYTIGTWYNPMTGEEGTELTFEIRTEGECGAPAPTFHNVSGGIRRPVTAEDVEFSIDFNIICGPGIAWMYTTVKDVNSTWVEGNVLHVRMNHESIWALDWISGIPVINKDLWNNIPDGEGDTCGWTSGPHFWTPENTPNPDWDPMAARTYDPTTDDVNGNGIPDLKEDGTGQWMFDSYVAGTSVHLLPDRNYYLCEEYLIDFIEVAFHYGYGDTSRNGRVESIDLGSIARALFKSGDPEEPYSWPPPGWGQWWAPADLDKSGTVDTADITVCAANFGEIVG